MLFLFAQYSMKIVLFLAVLDGIFLVTVLRVPVRVVSLVFACPFVDFFFLLFLDYRRFTISCSRLTQWRAASLSKVG